MMSAVDDSIAGDGAAFRLSADVVDPVGEPPAVDLAPPLPRLRPTV